MRIHIPPQIMAQLRSMGREGEPLWDAIEGLRSNQTPTDSFEVEGRPGRREMHVRVGSRGFWIGWEVEKDRGETVIRIILTEEN